MTSKRNYLKPEKRLKLYEWLLINRNDLNDKSDHVIADSASKAMDFKITRSNINSLRVTMRKMGRMNQIAKPQAGKSQHWTRAVMMGLLQTMKEIGVQPSGELIAMYETTKGSKAPEWMQS